MLHNCRFEADIMLPFLHLIGIAVIVISFYYFYLERKHTSSIIGLFIILGSIILMILSAYPNILLGMDINDMDLETALSLYSIVIQMIFGGVGFIGIIITIIWTRAGADLRKKSTGIISFFLLYFLIVMYFIFFSVLRDRIATLNQM